MTVRCVEHERGRGERRPWGVVEYGPGVRAQHPVGAHGIRPYATLVAAGFSTVAGGRGQDQSEVPRPKAVLAPPSTAIRAPVM